MSKEVDFFRKHLMTSGGVESFIKHLMQVGQQNVHTPFCLCQEIVERLKEYTHLSEKRIAVLFNIEFLNVLARDFGVKPSQVFMFADDAVEMEFCRLQYGMKPGVNLFLIDIEKTVKAKKLVTNEGECKMKFDVVVGNPPYHPPTKTKTNDGGSGSGATLYDKFVEMTINKLVKNDGFICMVHPNRWRRPGDYLWDLMAKQDIKYLEIHNKEDGERTFGVTTRYDWYVMKCGTYSGTTVIKDELGAKVSVDLRSFFGLPNFDFELFRKISTQDESESCKVMYSYSAYESRKEWISKDKKDPFVYPVVRATGKTGVKFVWSKIRSDFFGISKVIFGDGDVIANAIVDWDGEFAMNSHAMAIPISTKEEGEQIKKALESDKFNLFLRATRWSNFQIDWRMFKYFRKDFWKEFI